MPEACNWKELLRVARWKTRSALRENRHFSRGKHKEVPASSRARENCQRASGHAATYPELSLDDIAPRKHGTCFGSSIRKFEAGSETSIRIERTHVRCVLRVEPRVDSRNMSAILHNRELGRAFAKSTRFWALLRVGKVKTRGALRVKLENTRSMHLEAAASSRTMENSESASGKSAFFSRQTRASL